MFRTGGLLAFSAGISGVQRNYLEVVSPSEQVFFAHRHVFFYGWIHSNGKRHFPLALSVG